MKYVIVLGDGMADRPIEAFGGLTPLEYAKTPTLDSLCFFYYNKERNSCTRRFIPVEAGTVEKEKET